MARVRDVLCLFGTIICNALESNYAYLLTAANMYDVSYDYLVLDYPFMLYARLVPNTPKQTGGSYLKL